MAVGTAHNTFDLVTLTALPYLPVKSGAAPPAFPCENLITASADDFGSKWVAFRPMGIGVCPMLFQVFSPAFYFKLYALPNPLWNNRFVVIPYIKHLDFPFVLCPLLGQEIYRIAFL